MTHRVGEQGPEIYIAGSSSTVYRTTAYVPISGEMAADAGWWPWLRPDPPPYFDVDLFPRLTAVWYFVGDVGTRLLLASRILRFGPPRHMTWSDDG